MIGTPSSRLAWCFVALPLAAMAACATTAPTSSGASSGRAEAARDGVFVHVRSGPDDAHSVLMALQMATLMSEDRDVLVYFDVDGIGAVLSTTPDMKGEPFGSFQDKLRTLLARGVPVYACPSCLKATGHDEQDLFPGVRVADKEAFFSFTRGRILSLDY